MNCDDEDPEADGWGANLDTLNTFTAGGSFDKQYIYCPAWLAEALTDDFGYTVTKGWYDVNDEEFTKNCADTVVDFGTGILAKSASKGAEITFAGAVKDTPTVTDVGAFTIAANSSPVVVKIGELIVNCDEEDPDANGWGANLDTVNTFTAGGSFDKQYIYCPTWLAEALTDDFGYTVTKGWYDVNDEEFTENCNDKVEFAAGDGILMKSASVGATVTIKSALKK